MGSSLLCWGVLLTSGSVLGRPSPLPRTGMDSQRAVPDVVGLDSGLWRFCCEKRSLALFIIRYHRATILLMWSITWCSHEGMTLVFNYPSLRYIVKARIALSHINAPGQVHVIGPVSMSLVACKTLHRIGPHLLTQRQTKRTKSGGT